MDFTDIQSLTDIYQRKLAATETGFKRYLYHRINWNVRLIGIKGDRGTGKTTMLLQHIRETFPNPGDAFYVSLDNLWFNNYSLEELVEFLYARGITHIYFDEVHKYPNWTQTLKHFYDSYPELNMVYTGSAMTSIDNSVADLSRRQSLYTLRGMSFREYLCCEGFALPRTVELVDLLSNHVGIAREIVKETKVLKYFDKYLKCGFYPYYKEAGGDYPMRLADVARQVIEGDIPSVENISHATMVKIKKLLMVIASNVPLEPNVNKLSAQLESSRDQTLKMLWLLDKAGLLMMLTDRMKDYKHLAGIKKIYLGNANLMYALSTRVSVGTVRETFFASQVGSVTSLTAPKRGDFLADGKYLFEVGGRKKSFEQTADLPDSYLAVDDIETGFGNRIPLWMFGFLY